MRVRRRQQPVAGVAPAVLMLAAGTAAAVLALAPAAPVAAQTELDINPGNVPTNAADYDQGCEPDLGGGPYPEQDVWVFNLPGNRRVTGDFLEITAVFETPQGQEVVTIPDDGGEIVVDMGTSKAYILLPADGCSRMPRR